MTEILELILLILLTVLLFSVLSRVIKRLRLRRRLVSLGRLEGVEVELLCSPLLSLVRLSSRPEALVRIYDTVYAIRLYNGGGVGKVVHFASEEFTVRFSRLRTGVYTVARRAATGGAAISTRSGFAVGTRVLILPKMSLDSDSLNSRKIKLEPGQRVKPVLIFNPAPGEVSYVSETKNSIKVAFTGDEIYGTKIFTLSTFSIFVDREARRIGEMMNRETASASSVSVGTSNGDSDNEYAHFFDFG